MFFTTLSMITKGIFVKICWKNGLESACAALCKWATCMPQTFLSKTFANLLNMQKQYEKKNVWEKSNDVHSLSIRVQTMIYHSSVCFLPISVSKKTYFQSMSWKRDCVTHWREQHGMDSYQQWQISQSDCDVSSNCGKILN